MHSPSSSAVIPREQARLNRITAYLRDHSTEALNLMDLARLAGFSKFHFHRLFKARYGETPGDYLKRIRLEQAACKLLGNCNTSITDIAYEFGFSSSQHFTNSFKEHYGVPPSLVRNRVDWRTLLLKKIQVMENAYGKKHCLPARVKKEQKYIQIPVVTEDHHSKAGLQELALMDFPSYRVACIRLQTVPFSESMTNAAQRIIQWSVTRKLYLVGGGQHMIAVEIVPDAAGQFTFNVCVTIPQETAIVEEDNIKIRRLPEGRYGVYHGKFRTIADFSSARAKLIQGWWLSSYFPRDRRPLYVIIYNALAEDASRNWLVDICLPITTLSQ